MDGAAEPCARDASDARDACDRPSAPAGRSRCSGAWGAVTGGGISEGKDWLCTLRYGGTGCHGNVLLCCHTRFCTDSLEEQVGRQKAMTPHIITIYEAKDTSREGVKDQQGVTAQTLNSADVFGCSQLIDV